MPDPMGQGRHTSLAAGARVGACRDEHPPAEPGNRPDGEGRPFATEPGWPPGPESPGRWSQTPTTTARSTAPADRSEASDTHSVGSPTLTVEPGTGCSKYRPPEARSKRPPAWATRDTAADIDIGFWAG